MAETHLVVEKAGKNDLMDILSLQKECYQTEAALYSDYTIPPLTQSYHSILQEFEEGVLFLKGLADGKLIGSVRGYIKDNTAFIGRLIVSREYQNKGFGKSLMKHIEYELSSSIRYELFTGHKSKKNLELYRKLGYCEIKRQVINENLTLVYLEKCNQEN